MEPTKIYTLGYSGRTPQELKAIVESLDANLIDVRYSPASRMPQWSGLRLRQLFGDRYTHLRQFGNVNYKNDGPIQLVSYEAGREALRGAFSDRPIILMCVCSDPAICHRTHIANLLRQDGFEVAEWLPVPLPRQPDPLQPELL